MRDQDRGVIENGDVSPARGFLTWMNYSLGDLEESELNRLFTPTQTSVLQGKVDGLRNRETAIRLGVPLYRVDLEAGKVIDAVKGFGPGSDDTSAAIVIAVATNIVDTSRLPLSPVIPLKHTEGNVLAALAKAYNTKEISALLGYGESSIVTFKSRILKKFGVPLRRRSSTLVAISAAILKSHYETTVVDGSSEVPS
ncbi:MAG: hypothetical protein NUV69_03755 [Candidatus Curtissbacteria bacterium]|nr:hypothetical protein [Candidatus Curtissbacteria bacterium]